MADPHLAMQLAAATVLGFVGVQAVGSLHAAGQRACFALTFPRTAKAEQVTAAMRSLTGLLPPWWRRLLHLPNVVLETSATEAGIAHRLIVERRHAAFVVGQLKAALPGLRAERVDEPPIRRPQLARELRVAGAGRLRTDSAKPLSAGILASLQPLRPGEMVTAQWILAPTTFWSLASRLRQFAALLAGPNTAPVPPGRQPERVEPELLAVGRVGISANDPTRRRGLVAQVLGSFHAAGSADGSFRRRLLPNWLVAGALLGRTPILGYPASLGADELASVVGVPIEGPQLPGLAYVGARDLPPVPDVPRRGRVLGHAKTDPTRPVAVGIEESTKGAYVLAPTGAGKSTVIENLVCQDMAAGRSVVVIESKGDLITDLCDRVPKKRLGDVIVFDPADAERPVGFNMLGGGEATADLITDHVVGQFKQLYRSYLGPRSEDLLRASLTTLAADPRATLCDVPLLLTDDGFRQRLLSRIDDPVLESVWAWFDGLSAAQRSEVVSPLMNKLRAFTLRRRLRTVIGQAESKLDFDRIVRERKILLISLAKGLIGEDAAALLGSAMLARLWQAIAGRAALPAAKRTPLFIYCDEAQDFLRLPVALGDAIAQSRGYGVGWTIAHQHLSQLPTDLRQACLANLRTKLVLQTTATDAAVLAREFSPHLERDDLQGLGPFEGYAAVSVGAAVAPPASITTLPPPPATGSAAAVRERSRKRYGRDAREVEAELRARIEGSAPPAPIGKRRRP